MALKAGYGVSSILYKLADLFMCIVGKLQEEEGGGVALSSSDEISMQQVSCLFHRLLHLYC